MSRLLSSLALGAAAMVSACSSSEGPAAACVEHTSSAASSTSAEAKSVSFEADVLPIFSASCTFGSCHGSPNGPGNNGIYLGARGGGNHDAAKIRAALVEGSSPKLPSMKYVKPFDAASSYLLVKIDGSFCAVPECADGRCGDRMPRGGSALDPAAIETITLWIAQGAPAK